MKHKKTQNKLAKLAMSRHNFVQLTIELYDIFQLKEESFRTHAYDMLQR